MFRIDSNDRRGVSSCAYHIVLFFSRKRHGARQCVVHEEGWKMKEEDETVMVTPPRGIDETCMFLAGRHRMKREGGRGDMIFETLGGLGGRGGIGGELSAFLEDEGDDFFGEAGFMAGGPIFMINFATGGAVDHRGGDPGAFLGLGDVPGFNGFPGLSCPGPDPRPPRRIPDPVSFRRLDPLLRSGVIRKHNCFSHRRSSSYGRRLHHRGEPHRIGQETEQHDPRPHRVAVEGLGDSNKRVVKPSSL